MLVSGKRRDNLLSPSQPLKKGVNKKCRYRTNSYLENTVLEINHVTNVTTVLSETTASDRVSRYYAAFYSIFRRRTILPRIKANVVYRGWLITDFVCYKLVFCIPNFSEFIFSVNFCTSQPGLGVRYFSCIAKKGSWCRMVTLSGLPL